jgi:hypothetical protein
MYQIGSGLRARSLSVLKAFRYQIALLRRLANHFHGDRDYLQGVEQ